MKLKQFYIDDYRVLQKLALDFERERSASHRVSVHKTYALDFLAGVNGTGKTTALQFVAKLFAHLYATDHFVEPFEITYQIAKGSDIGQQVKITNIADDATSLRAGSGLFRYAVDGGEYAHGKLPAGLLPHYVVIYTTGSENEWQQRLETDAGSDEQTEELLPDGSKSDTVLPGHRPNLRTYDDEHEADPSDSKVLFIRASHLPLVVLCGLIAPYLKISEENAVLASVLEDIQLEAMPAFSLRIRAHANLTAPDQLALIEQLVEVADQVVQRAGDRLLLFDMDTQRRKKESKHGSIFGLRSTPIDLFQDLYGLFAHRPFYDPPLQEVNLFFRRLNQKTNAEADQAPDADGHAALGAEDEQKPTTPMLLLYDWLSDGERSFLARMALFALFRADDLLILLDEPEVHFNDVWKREIVQKIDEIMSGCASHALITTHSSIVLSDVPADDILVLRREGTFTSGNEHAPGIATFGADPSDILVHVFGTLSPNGARSRNFIREEISKRRTSVDLDALSEIVAPGYWRYRIQLESQSIQGKVQ